MIALAGQHLGAGTFVSLIRLGVVSLVCLATILETHGAAPEPGFPLIGLLAGAYAAVALAVAVVRAGRATTGLPWIAADLAFLALLAYGAGGASSEIDLAFTLPPAIAAVLGRPRHVLALLAGTVALYAASTILHAAATGAIPVSDALTQTTEAVVRGALVVMFALVLDHRAAAAYARARASQKLVGQIMVEEEAVRRQLASELHDTHLQNLYAAQFELQARGSDDDSLALASGLIEGTLAGLRDRVADLYPATLEHVGLGPALEELASRKASMTGITISAEVQEDFSKQSEQLAYATARELLVNAIKHADASNIDIRVDHNDGQALVEVSDDGVGLTTQARATAVREGHIGLASIQDRVEAIGGFVRATRSRDGNRDAGSRSMAGQSRRTRDGLGGMKSSRLFSLLQALARKG